VIVDGKVIVERGCVSTLDPQAVMAEARAAAGRLARRAGLPSLAAQNGD
jgi:hypothetical protein